MSTLKDLIDSNRRLGDATLGQSHAITKLASAFDRLQPSFEQLRHDVYDIKNDRELDQDKIEMALGRINEKLVLLVDNVKDTQSDMRSLTKEVTGTHLLPPHEPKKQKIVEIIEAFERLGTTTKLLIFIFMLVAAMSGWLSHIWTG